MTQKVISYQVADTIDVKSFCAAYKAELYFNDPAELFYRVDANRYIYVFKYGAVCFLNCDTLFISEFILLIKPFCKNLFDESLTDEFMIEIGAKEVRVGFVVRPFQSANNINSSY